MNIFDTIEDTTSWNKIQPRSSQNQTANALIVALTARFTAGFIVLCSLILLCWFSVTRLPIICQSLAEVSCQALSLRSSSVSESNPTHPFRSTSFVKLSSVQDEDASRVQEKSLEQQWQEYLISPIKDSQRQAVLDSLTQAERNDMDTTIAKSPDTIDAIAAQIYLQRLCEMGPRISGSKSMKVQQQGLRLFFEGMGATVASQSFTIPHPETRKSVELVNLIVQLHPEKKNRILFCCHYDTRPYADQDPKNPRASLPGANDGASGVGLFMVLAPHLQKIDQRLGIDLVFFDAEELVYDRSRDALFLGSIHFANQYVRSAPDYRYQAGVLIDMIADKTLELYYEKNSLNAAGPLTKSVWNKARQLKVAEFVAKPLHQVRDDHLALNEIAKIPTTDLIDFDYPAINSSTSYWHTTQDTPDKCSPVSMAKVGVVLLEWAKDYTK